ncbi:hypothetical protein QQF64_002176 [Cirrhinus molitorella]|uniref:Uncharacterized protein n=1 Tax=Cirrhinus molitorella TaxID=172907 RepID=A0ABR3MPD9_9TELE
MRYQHGLSTPDLRQTLPNLKNFLEHGLLVRCDRHHVSMSIPVPLKSHLSVSGASEVGFPTLSSSPERDVQKRAGSDADKQKYQTPPPSYTTAMTQPDPMTTPEVPSAPSAEIVSVEIGKTVDTHEVGETVPEAHIEKPLEIPTDIASTLPSDSVAQHPGAMNGSAMPSEGIGLGVAGAAELCCSVEQAEEIMGTEATGLGLGLGLGGGARLDDYPCIPVEHAVAVECDEQVLGEFDTAGIEEVSRRIYALENMSSFRRPRKNSEK